MATMNQQNVRFYGNSPYEVMKPASLFGAGVGGSPWSSSSFSQPVFDNLIKTGALRPFQMNGMQSAAQTQQGSGAGNMTGKLPDMYNRLTMQASDALYGGILGYQPKPITSPTGNQYQPPTNQGFQFPFGLLNRNFLGS